MVIERLSELSSESIDAMVAESEQAGYRFMRRLAEEWASGANRFDSAGEAFFAALIGGRVIGVCGLNVDPHACEPNVGRVRHLYVLSAYRRLGVGRQLVTEVMATARGRFARLHLRTNNPAAAQLYESLGFRRCVGAGDFTHIKE